MSRFEWGNQLPTLDGARVRLRPLSQADAADVFAVFADPEVMRYWDHGPMTAVAEAAEYIREIDEHFRRRDLFQWGISHQTDRAVIGTCTLLNISTAHQRAEIGFALAQAHWGRGLATEAVTALVSFAFDRLNVHRLEADADPRNDRSLRLLERLGFRREGYLRERYYLNGERQDAVVLGLLRPEWHGHAGEPRR